MNQLLDNLRVTLVGYGRVGRALGRALAAAGARVVAVAEHEDSERVRDAQEDGYFVLPASMVETEVDLIAVAVGDTALAPVVSDLAANVREARKRSGGRASTTGGTAPAVLHTSGRLGTVPLAPLGEMGFEPLAWHPIQTFAPGDGRDRFHGITVGMTGSASALELGGRIADALGARTMVVPEDDRVRYHLAAVLASNFMPLMLDMGARQIADVAGGLGEAAAALYPLMAGMTRSIGQHGPAEAMTGPVARDDVEAVLSHAEAMIDPGDRELYFSLTRALVDLARRTGAMSDERTAEWVRRLSGGNGAG